VADFKIAGTPAARHGRRAVRIGAQRQDALRDRSKNAASHFAAMRGARDVLALLAEFGAAADLANAQGKTPAELLEAGEPQS